MPDIPRVGDLEIHQDLRLQRLEWTVQRIGWLVMALIVLAGLVGLLGRGPLSSASATTPDGSLRVEYNRFLNYHDPSVLLLDVAGGATTKGLLRVRLSQDYLNEVQIEEITPRPERVEAGPDGHVFVFSLSEPASPTRIRVDFKANSRLTISGRIGVVGKDTAEISHFVYP